MQYRVPQNIDMEDKIIGPLTLKQFMYVAIGGSLVYIIITKIPMPLSLLVGFPVGFFILALTFYKPQDQPFSHFLTALISYLTKPRQRVWIKGTVEEAIILPHKEVAQKQIIPKKKINKSELQKLAQILDSGGWKSLENTETPHTTQQVMQREQTKMVKEAKELEVLDAKLQAQNIPPKPDTKQVVPPQQPIQQPVAAAQNNNQ